MGNIILISGKGGTGKTTIASLLVRILKEKHRGSILAVDADPNSNLAEALGG
jgi:CO dehydrogenase maturation factor